MENAMCRMFAHRANQATRAYESLIGGTHCLRSQSCCDARSSPHQDGWGVGYFVDGRPRQVRSPLPAGNDPRYEQTAKLLSAPTLLAHVRRASAGKVDVRNCHPFLHGSWLFAHNGTLVGFPAARERLRTAIPDHLRRHIQGDTDSEHAFYLVLGRLEKLVPSAGGPADLAAVRRAVTDAIGYLADLCPGRPGEPSEFNFILTDGHTLVATRWGHTLSRLERRGRQAAGGDQPEGEPAAYHAVVVASEPTTDEAWVEVPDRHLLWVDADLNHGLATLA
jgi:glutamine amidotransferase